MDLHPGPPVCRTGALLSELRGPGAEGPNRTAGARVFSAALYLLSYLGMSIHQRAGWASIPRGPDLQTGSSPGSDTSPLMERTTGLEPVISGLARRRSTNLSYVRMDPGRGLEPRFSASKAALLPLETSPESWLGAKDLNHRLQVQSLATYR